MIQRHLRLMVATMLVGALAACAHAVRVAPDHDAVRDVRLIGPSVVLLTMHLPPKNPATDAYDASYGTGFAVASGDWGTDILTVQHVINHATHLHVTLANKRRLSARIVAENADADLALVRIRGVRLRVLVLGISHGLQRDVGREVGLIGYPIPDEFQAENLGLAQSFNAGRFSAVRKDSLELMLPIVPGESGAPIFLLDTAEIIGLADSRFDDEHSIGFAIPIDSARTWLHHVDPSHGF